VYINDAGGYNHYSLAQKCHKGLTPGNLIKGRSLHDFVVDHLWCFYLRHAGSRPRYF
jgi:hypothetical protein